MIVDLAKFQWGKRIHRRICIIGTGMGGGSFITRYAGKRDDCVVVEAGSAVENTAINYESIGRDFGLGTTRVIALGGTSNIWKGLCGLLDPIDFESRPWIPHSGWPIDLEDLKPYLAEAGKMLGLPEFSYFSPLKSHRELTTFCNDIDFDRQYLSHKFFIHKRPPLNFKDAIRTRFKNAENLLLMNATAVEVVMNSAGNLVRKVIVRDPRGRQVDIYAECFVIAAGALETPRLLLNSRRWGNPGADHSSANIGRFLMDHPMGSLSQVKLERLLKAPLFHSLNIGPRQHIKTGLVLKENLQCEHRLPNHCFHLWPSFLEGIDDSFENLRRKLITSPLRSLGMNDFLTLASHPNTIYRILSYFLPVEAYYRNADLFFVTEQIPNPQSRVSLSEKKDRFGYPVARVKWMLSNQDLASIADYNQLALNALTVRAHSLSHSKEPSEFSKILTSAAHHLGTARMSSRPENGVVDRNLKVWGVHNLFISDASVFPTSGNVNPGMTICALAIRLADHLLETSARSSWYDGESLCSEKRPEG